jgi:hypothetical protein
MIPTTFLERYTTPHVRLIEPGFQLGWLTPHPFGWASVASSFCAEDDVRTCGEGPLRGSPDGGPLTGVPGAGWT